MPEDDAAQRMTGGEVAVLKFGSSVLTDDGAMPGVVHEIYAHVRAGRRVVAVVSAVGPETDGLIARARRLCPEPEPGSLAALLATGETASAALLGVALERAGVPAGALGPGAIGLRTTGPTLDAEPAGLDTRAILAALEKRPVLVIPGFVGRDEHGATTLLGRGGSDLTAVFVAHRLGAVLCCLYKDVDGLYERDPREPGPAPARRYETLSLNDAIEVNAKIFQPKAARYAHQHGVPIEVTRAGARCRTLVGEPETRLVDPDAEPAPTRVALLGLGTVGGGVLERLGSLGDRFRVVGAAVRDVERHAGRGVPRALLSADPREILGREADAVVELIGGLSPASELIEAALRSGRDVVTANKAVIARDGERLRAVAREHGRGLLYSASVGGGVPMIETVDRLRAGGIESIEGALNGTCNFVLDLVADGASLGDAVRIAQEKGFAEADPTEDVSGADAANKLAILAWHAFGAELDPRSIPTTGLETLDTAGAQAARAEGRATRLVARCRRTGSGVEASVGLEEVGVEHPLARIRGEENCLVVVAPGGALEWTTGKGAGRWPTAESVIADLCDVREARASCPAPGATRHAEPGRRHGWAGPASGTRAGAAEGAR